MRPLVFALALLVPPLLFGNSYLMNAFVLVGVYAILVIALDLLIGYSGQISLGHNGFFAIGAYVSGILVAKLGVSPLLALVAAIAVTCFVGLLIGLATLRLQGHFLAIATLGFGVIVVVFVGSFTSLTGGYSGLAGISRISIAGFAFDTDLKFYFLIWGVALLIYVIAHKIVNSRVGRAIRAIGVDELAAQACGIWPARYKIAIFLVTAVFASVAGSLYAHFLTVITPNHFDLPVVIEMLLMLFLGGKESLWGAFLGAGVLKILPEAVQRFDDYKVLIEGLVFAAILFFMPMGIAGMLNKLGSRLGRGKPVKMLKSAETNVERKEIPWLRRRNGADKYGNLLEVSDLTKNFGGLAAVSNLSFVVRCGQLKAIIGPNGAGKTTVFNLLTGVLTPTRGTVRFKGMVDTFDTLHRATACGLARTFQMPRPFRNMTVLENMMIGQHARTQAEFLQAVLPAGDTKREEAMVVARSLEVLEFIGLRHRAHDMASSLPFGEQRLCELARALMTEPDMLLLDEPAAGLNETEKVRLAELLSRIREHGITILLVEHDMRLVMRITDEIVVLNYGEKIAEGSPSAVRKDPGVIAAYLGEAAIRA